MKVVLGVVVSFWSNSGSSTTNGSPNQGRDAFQDDSSSRTSFLISTAVVIAYIALLLFLGVIIILRYLKRQKGFSENEIDEEIGLLKMIHLEKEFKTGKDRKNPGIE